MSATATLSQSLPAASPLPSLGSLHSWSVDDYHRMIASGILNDDDRVELLEGQVVQKMPRSARHDPTMGKLNARLVLLQLPGWVVRCQATVTLDASEPEPDLALARGGERDYDARHPGPADLGLVVEVADTSLERDRKGKARLYAEAGIPIYWLVNLVERHIEVHTQPDGTDTAGYARIDYYGPSESVALVLDGQPAGVILVSDI